MYQNCCKKCGSTSLHTEVKGNNTGLYCDDCGAWIKWLGKDELRAFNYSKLHSDKSKTYTKEEISNAIDNLKDYDNYKPFHDAVDKVLEMFENMK